MSRWFRLHDEILDDPKVQKLAPEDFKAWINLLCLASRNGGKLPSAEDISFALRLPIETVSTVLERLLNATLIVQRSGGANGSHYAPYKWDERQYKSDSSTDRVKRFRQRSKPVPETAPDTEAETDTPLDKSNGAAPVDLEQKFWDDGKAYLTDRGVKNPGGIIGKWRKLHSREVVLGAITRCQIERASDPVPFIEACLNGKGRLAYNPERVTV